MKHYLLAICFVWVCFTHAQDFNYSVSLDSSIQYTELSNATILSDTGKWLPRYEIETGFTTTPRFSATFVVETNGFLVFNQHLNFALMAFSGFRCKQDSTGHYSRLSYTISGESGSKLLKLEFKNTGQGNDVQEALSYQLWVRENGVFEIFTGPHTYETMADDTNQVVHIGLVNRNMDQPENGLFLSGNPAAPTSTPVNAEHNAFTFMQTVPKKGYRYIFTPIAP